MDFIARKSSIFQELIPLPCFVFMQNRKKFLVVKTSVVGDCDGWMSSKGVCGSRHLLNWILLKLWVRGNDIWAYGFYSWKCSFPRTRNSSCDFRNYEKNLHQVLSQIFKFNGKETAIISNSLWIEFVSTKGVEKSSRIRKLYGVFFEF
jgi:hypothetical protein